jgi:hypothetical protein
VPIGAQTRRRFTLAVEGSYRARPLVTLTYPTKSEAEVAHGLTAKAITGAAVTPHAA